jgi:paired amphipathic helix protein Sin3a
VQALVEPSVPQKRKRKANERDRDAVSIAPKAPTKVTPCLATDG